MRRSFALARREPDGTTYRDHLVARAALRGGEKARAELVVPTYHPSARYLLGWFFELHQRRGYTQYGPLPLTWGEMDAWARRTKRDPWSWEWYVIGLLDAAALSPDEKTPDVKTKAHDTAWPEAKSA